MNFLYSEGSFWLRSLILGANRSTGVKASLDNLVNPVSKHTVKKKRKEKGVGVIAQ